LGQRRRVSSADAPFAFVPPRCKRVPRLRAFSGRRRDVFVEVQAIPSRWNARDLSEDFFRFRSAANSAPTSPFSLPARFPAGIALQPCFPQPGGRESTSIFDDRTTPLPTHVRREPAAPSLRAVWAHLALSGASEAHREMKGFTSLARARAGRPFGMRARLKSRSRAAVTRAPVQSTNFETSRTYEA
jgi:hypothetical protein